MKSEKRKKSPSSGKAPALSGPGIYLFVWATIILGIVLLVTMSLWRKPPASAEGDSLAAASAAAEATNTETAAATVNVDFQKLVGKWLRPDGGYVIEIKSVDADGKLEAAYFNPRPIHVAKAEAKSDGGLPKVFIELRDVNYPGSTYTLTYVPQRDLLVGIYYQAVEQQSYEVYFERVP